MALATVIRILGASAVALISQLSRQVASSQRASQARYAAKAGLSRALLELSKDPLWGPSSLVLPDGDADSLDFRDQSLGCRIRVANNWNGAAPIAAPDATMVQPGRVWLECTGTLHGQPLAGSHGIAAALAVKPDVVFDLAVYQRAGVLNIAAPTALVASYRPRPARPRTPVGETWNSRY